MDLYRQRVLKLRNRVKNNMKEKTREINKVETVDSEHDNGIGHEEVKESDIASKLALKTNEELRAILDEYNIYYTTRMAKNDLVSLIIKNMEG